MLNRDCPLCGHSSNSPLSRKTPAVICEFIWRYACIDYSAYDIKSVLCGICGLVYYDHGFTEAESILLYGGYRDARYNQTRRFIEKRYTPPSATEIESYIAKRSMCLQKFIREDSALFDFLTETASPGAVERLRILDFGSPDATIVTSALRSLDLPSVPVSTYDIGDPFPEVNTYNLIIADQLLEHLTHFDDIFMLLDHSRCDSFVIIGVPPEIREPARRTFCEFADNRSLDEHESFTAVHEHINFFSQSSITFLTDYISSRWNRSARFSLFHEYHIGYILVSPSKLCC